MKIVMTFPGRFGDILWAMPSARALAETYDQPIGLVLSPKYGSLAELLRLQPYLASVTVDPAWELHEEAPIQPRIPPTPVEADLVVHGGYKGWPSHPLPYEIHQIVFNQGDLARHHRPLDLARPWITVPPPSGVVGLTEFDPQAWAFPPHDYVVGFSDEWLELKYGTYVLGIRYADAHRKDDEPRLSGRVLYAKGSRWDVEAGAAAHPCSWLAAAYAMSTTKVFLGCCSALHVLAVAMGKPCVIVEPNEMRWNPIFWPLGMDGPEVTCVKGLDGKPTWDARHCGDTLRQVLSTVPTGGTR